MSGGKYVPPSRRAGFVPSLASAPPASAIPRSRLPPAHGTGSDLQTYTIDVLSEHFQHPQDSTITFFSHPALKRPPREPLRYDPARPPEATPLPPSPPPPPPAHILSHLVSYVCIFPNAHPAWDERGELWTHTNADKLVEDWEGQKRNFGRPVPVFRMVRGSRVDFGFYGWWLIQSLQVIPAGSAELIRMLEAKEVAKGFGSRQGRTAAAWAHSLNTTWIKLTLARAPPVGETYTELKDPMTLRGGKGGEVERYLLEVGGLDDEVAMLEGEGADEEVATLQGGESDALAT